MKKLKYFWNEKPLLLILIAGGFFRLLAVFFAKGYGMSDDHFLVIEPSQSWVDGFDYDNWLPVLTKGLTQASGHSLLYPGLHYILFYLFKLIGIVNPNTKMILIRFLHAVYSMIVIVTGYKIAEKVSGKNCARLAGLLLAIAFFMPWLSVRNLVEVVCIPPLMLATWYIYKYDNENYKAGLFAGIMLGLAFSIRFQTATFIAGFGLALLLMQRWKTAIYLIAGLVLSVGIVQLTTDVLIWKKPFVEFSEYVRFNIVNRTAYGGGSWYKYLLLLSGILIPPMSIILMIGFLKSWRKHFILFFPAFLFFVFHSSFPNKQERFIIPFIPFLITCGMIGWYEILHASRRQWLNKLNRVAWIVFFILNTIPLFVCSMSYSKRSRVESMLYLYKKGDTKTICVEESIHSSVTLPPLFYLGKWGTVYDLSSTRNMDTLLCDMQQTKDKTSLPQYVLFNQTDDLEKRVIAFKKYFPGITFEAEIKPGFIDALLNRLNPHNANFTIYIYKIHYGDKEWKSINSANCIGHHLKTYIMY
jgi:ribosomal protein L21E